MEIPVTKSAVETAISALIKTKSISEKLQLLPEDDYFYLVLTLKKIPSKSHTNPIKIPVPHPLYDAASQLCLIIDDRPKSTTADSEQVKKLIKSQNTPISKVLKLSKLKSNYKAFEAKRKLCNSYDLFLADRGLVHLLPKLLGKEFFKRKKLPLRVDVGKKNLNSQVENAMGSTLFYVKTGTCCVMKVGKMAMEKGEVVENVFSAIKGAVENVPKNWGGVRSLHLKLCDSVALPVYQSMPDLKLKIEGVKEKIVEVAKVSDSEGEVKESSVKKSKKNKKGRIHEVRYMDVDDVMVSDDDDDNDEVAKSEGIDELAGKIEDENDDEIEDEIVTVEKVVGKKRSNSKDVKEGVSGEVNGEKRAKKAKGVDLSGKEVEDEVVAAEKVLGKKRNNSKNVNGGVSSELNGEKRAKKKAKGDELSGKEESGKKMEKKTVVVEKRSSKIVVEKDEKKPIDVEKRSSKRTVEKDAKKPSEVEKKSGKRIVEKDVKKLSELEKKSSKKIVEKDEKKSSKKIVEKDEKKSSELEKKSGKTVAKAKDVKPKKKVSAK